MVSFGKNSRFLAAALLAMIFISGCGGAEERKAKYLERGKAYFEEENYDKAKVEFKNVLQIDPKTPEPHYYLGRIAQSNQEWRKAFGSYRKAVDFIPEFVYERARLGIFYLLAGDVE